MSQIKQWERDHQRSVWLLSWQQGSRKNVDVGSILSKAVAVTLGVLAWGVKALSA